MKVKIVQEKHLYRAYIPCIENSGSKPMSAPALADADKRLAVTDGTFSLTYLRVKKLEQPLTVHPHAVMRVVDKKRVMTLKGGAEALFYGLRRVAVV